MFPRSDSSVIMALQVYATDDKSMKMDSESSRPEILYEVTTHKVKDKLTTEERQDDETEHHLTGLKLYLIVAGLSISVLLVVLVR